MVGGLVGLCVLKFVDSGCGVVRCRPLIVVCWFVGLLVVFECVDDCCLLVDAFGWFEWFMFDWMGCYWLPLFGNVWCLRF